MNRDQFWKIIEQSRSESGTDVDAQCLRITVALEALPAAEIGSFGRHFDELLNQAYRWDLWAAAYLIGGGCSDDAFFDFRAWLISRGKHDFEAALAHPDAVAEIELLHTDLYFFEGFQYAAEEAYESKTGLELPPSGVPVPSEPSGTPWDEDDRALQQLCPRLFAKYGAKG